MEHENNTHRQNDEKMLVHLAILNERGINLEEKIDKLLSTNIDVEKRLATLELWKEGMMGKLAVFTIVIGAGWTLIVKKFF